MNKTTHDYWLDYIKEKDPCIRRKKLGLICESMGGLITKKFSIFAPTYRSQDLNDFKQICYARFLKKIPQFDGSVKLQSFLAPQIQGAMTQYLSRACLFKVNLPLRKQKKTFKQSSIINSHTLTSKEKEQLSTQNSIWSELSEKTNAVKHLDSETFEYLHSEPPQENIEFDIISKTLKKLSKKNKILFNNFCQSIYSHEKPYAINSEQYSKQALLNFVETKLRPKLKKYAIEYGIIKDKKHDYFIR